jgi:hypothetical protein
VRSFVQLGAAEIALLCGHFRGVAVEECKEGGGWRISCMPSQQELYRFVATQVHESKRAAAAGVGEAVPFQLLYGLKHDVLAVQVQAGAPFQLHV